MKIMLSVWLMICSATASVFAHDIPQLSYDEYRAQRTKELNETNDLPKLDYWGVKGFEWGDAESRVTSLSGRSAALLGKSCTRKFECDKTTKELKQIRHDFAAGVTNREARLAVYHSLKADLIKAYNAPTRTIKEDEVFRGKDAYTQGLDKEYSLEWAGPETTVQLFLSDQELFVEFRQSPNSEAPVKKEKVRAAIQHKAEIQKLIEDDLKASKQKETSQPPR